MRPGIFRRSHLQRSYRASGKSAVRVQESVRGIETGRQVGIDDAQSGECTLFLDTHLSRPFCVVSGTGLSSPYQRIAAHRSYPNVSGDRIFRTAFLLYELWMDAEGANDVAKSVA